MTDTTARQDITAYDWNARPHLWAGPVRCRHCGTDKIAEVLVNWQGFLFVSLRVRWGKEANESRTRWTGFAPVTILQGQDGGPFAWVHDHCKRDDGPADLDKLERDAQNVKLQRRGYLVA